MENLENKENTENNENTENKDDLVVGGYQFATIADAETARQDLKRVKSLEDNLDFRKPQNVLAIYNKALEQRIFMTPIGMAYLLKVQGQLRRCNVPEDKIRPIRLYSTFTNKTEANRSIRRSIQTRKPKVEYKGRFFTSLGLNLVLIVAIITMFVISFESNSPTIANYRTAIENEYADWEQQLQEREQAVREAERNYGIEP